MLRKTSLLICAVMVMYTASAQTAKPTAMTRISDSLCNCFTGLDMKKITTKEKAKSAFWDCFTRQTGVLMELAAEEHVDATDSPGMSKLGKAIGEQLLKRNCANFVQISTLMSSKDVATPTTMYEGRLQKIETKEFVTVVLTDSDNQQKRFIWLRQFTGSEKYMSNLQNLIGKKMAIEASDLEVYIPSAHGYYKIKEITSMELLAK